MILEDMRKVAVSVELVGSRVTCDPAPKHTDRDVLVFVEKSDAEAFMNSLAQAGFGLDGSRVEDQSEYLSRTDTFQSFQKGELNVILSTDPEFFRRFMAATSVAKRLNLLVKDDRIALFQAVLYGNATSQAVARVPPVEEWPDLR